MSNARIVEEFMLPSNGEIYGDIEVNPSVTLGSMKARHEMLRLSASDESNKIMAEIIDDCLESDLGISSYDLCLGDFQFLLFKLRIVTFGPDYEVGGRCPFCGFDQTVKVNLDELEDKFAPENYEEMKSIILPVSGEEVRLTYQTPRILDRVNVKVKEYRRRNRGEDINPVILFNIMSVIETIDGEEMDAFDLEDWIMNLHLADANELINRIDEMNNAIGIDLETHQICTICGTDFVVPFRVNETFFRPHS